MADDGEHGRKRVASTAGAADLAALLGLAALCLAQPVLDLLARNTVFLTVHGLRAGEAAVLPAILIGGLGLALWLPVRCAGRIGGPRAGRVALAMVAAALLAAGLRPAFGKLLPVPGAAQLALALAVGIALVALARCRPAIWRQRGFLGWAAPLVVAAFLLAPGVRGFLAHGRPGEAALPAAPPDGATPLVMIVFDAFPSASLIDAQGGIDAVLSPNLADLARDAVWFPDALSESDDTLLALPSLLSGRRPRRGAQPLHAAHPENLMTWLAPHRPVQAFESHTRLDPTAGRAAWGPRWRLVLSDLWVVAAHVFMPADLAGALPAISHDWRDFAGRGADAAGGHAHRDVLMPAFLASLAVAEPHAAWFLHALVPHTPYQHLPSGRRYTRGGLEPGGEGLQGGPWSADEQAVVQSQQRHLLQVGYTDTYVGQVLAVLRERGLYERALIVVTADHGVAFTPGDARRELTAGNAGEILAVPLLIKPPGTGGGRRDPRVALPRDILPTVAGVLGTSLPWRADGRDLLAAGPAEAWPAAGDSLRFFAGRGDVVLRVGEVLAQRDRAVARKLRRFDLTGGLDGLFAPHRGRELLGTAPAVVPAPAGLAAGLGGQTTLFVSDDPADLLPAEVRGYATSTGDWPDGWDVAVTVDGAIAAVTRPRRRDAQGGLAGWAALLPEAALPPGERALGALLVRWQDGEPRVHAASERDLAVTGVDLLTASLPGLSLAGFHAVEPWGAATARWTDGHARIALRTVAAARIDAVEVEVLAAPPGGGELVVTVGGLPLAVLPLSGPWRGRLDLRDVETIEGFELAFFSPAFVPAQDAPPSGDRRRLGVALGGVVLRTLGVGEIDALPPRPAWLAHYPHDPAPWVQTGFHRAEIWGLSPASWTDGRATARVELPAPARPRFVLVELADTGPDGAAVELTLDGRVFFAADLAPGAWSGCVPVPEGEAAVRLELGLVSSTFVPAERLPGARDARPLGVAVRSLSLVF